MDGEGVGPLTNTVPFRMKKTNQIKLFLEKPTPTLRSVSFLFSGAELKKMDSNDRVISIYRPRHRFPIARKFSAIWGTLMVSKKN